MAIVETQSFQLSFPDSWVIRSLEPRATLIGPRGEQAELSSFSIAGNKAPPGHAKDALRSNLLSVFSTFGSDGSAHPRTELQRHESGGSEEFFQQIYVAADQGSAMGLFGLLHGNNALLVSVDVPRGAEQSILDVAECLDHIVWAQSKPRLRSPGGESGDC